MREIARNIFASLPKEGIAIHGTNLVAGRSIETEGFRKSTAWYYAQPPVGDISSYEPLLQDIRFVLEDALGRGVFKTMISEGEDNMPCIVVFKPLVDISNEKRIVQRFEEREIPSENILGVIPLGYITREEWNKITKIGNADYRKTQLGLIQLKIYRLLRRQGIVNPAKP